jgi:hypothetical protein
VHKHQTKHRRGNSRIANANYELSADDRKAIYHLLCGINGQEHFSVQYLISEFHSKYCDESLVPASERRANAIRKFLVCEDTNRHNNTRLLEIDEGFNILPRTSMSMFLRFARRLTRDILGPLRDEVTIGAFSGGASTSRSRTESLPALKYMSKADTTESAMKFLDIVFREMHC